MGCRAAGARSAPESAAQAVPMTAAAGGRAAAAGGPRGSSQSSGEPPPKDSRSAQQPCHAAATRAANAAQQRSNTQHEGSGSGRTASSTTVTELRLPSAWLMRWPSSASTMAAAAAATAWVEVMGAQLMGQAQAAGQAAGDSSGGGSKRRRLQEGVRKRHQGCLQRNHKGQRTLKNRRGLDWERPLRRTSVPWPASCLLVLC